MRKRTASLLDLSVCHKSFCRAIGMPRGAGNWYIGVFGNNVAKGEVISPIVGDQAPVSVPQVPLQGHWNAYIN